MFRAACILVLLSGLCAPFSAWAGACNFIFAGQQPPALVNSDLAQRTTLLCNDAYASLASGLSRGPLWSAEHLTADELARAHEVERQGEFHEEERLPPDDRATLSDYVRSGYDRGHMAPSGDMPDLTAQQQSFSLANIVPQTALLNRHVWEGIESAVRVLAEHHGGLYVVTGPIFQGRRLKSLKGRVLVPTAMWKAVYDPGAGGAGAYRCTNVARPRCTTVSIAVLERETGIDPFPAVPTVIKQTAMLLPRPEPSRYGHGQHPQRRDLSASRLP